MSAESTEDVTAAETEEQDDTQEEPAHKFAPFEDREA